jgi:hypothetical protein
MITPLLSWKFLSLYKFGKYLNSGRPTYSLDLLADTHLLVKMFLPILLLLLLPFLYLAMVFSDNIKNVTLVIRFI